MRALPRCRKKNGLAGCHGYLFGYIALAVFLYRSMVLNSDVVSLLKTVYQRVITLVMRKH